MMVCAQLVAFGRVSQRREEGRERKKEERRRAMEEGGSEEAVIGRGDGGGDNLMISVRFLESQFVGQGVWRGKDILVSSSWWADSGREIDGGKFGRRVHENFVHAYGFVIV